MFQLKTIIPDLDWGRKINSWTFSSVDLSVEHVTLPSTSPLPDTPPPPVPSPRTPTKDERKGRKGIREGRREERKKIQGKDSLRVS